MSSAQYHAGRMVILDTYWTPMINKHTILCSSCGTTFSTRSDRFQVQCPKCKRQCGITWMRNNWVRAQQID